MLETINSIDEAALLFFQNIRHAGVLDTVVEFLSKMGDMGALWILTGMLCFASRKYRKTGFNIIIAVALAIAASSLLKNIFARPRPEEFLAGFNAVINTPATMAFPSAHAAASFAGAFFYAVSIRKTGIPAYIMALLISASRLYLGVNYLSDLICGAVLGTVLAVIVFVLSGKFIKIPEWEEEDDG